MSGNKLLEVKKRIEPALNKPYLVDVRIFKDPESFFTRLWGLWAGYTLWVEKVESKMFFKKSTVSWIVDFRATKGKTLVRGTCNFGSVMCFEFANELDQMEAAVHIEEFFSKILEEEFVKYESVVKDKMYSEKK